MLTCSREVHPFKIIHLMLFILAAGRSAFAEQKGTLNCTGPGLTLELKLNGTCEIDYAEGGCLTVNGEHYNEYNPAVMEGSERVAYSGRHLASQREYSIIVPDNFKKHFESYVEDIPAHGMPLTVNVVCDVTK